MNLSLAKDRFTLLDAPNSCIDCHSNLENKRLSAPVSLWSKSVHAEVDNTCYGCHGGDSDDHTENSMSAAKNFIAVPQEDDIVKFCGKYNQGLSENFMASAHGATGQPTCIGCYRSHTIHRISLDIINEKNFTECHDYDPAGKLWNSFYNCMNTSVLLKIK